MNELLMQTGTFLFLFCGLLCGVGLTIWFLHCVIDYAVNSFGLWEAMVSFLWRREEFNQWRMRKEEIARCTVTPAGYERCTREAGHSGPCAHRIKGDPKMRADL